MLKEPNTSSQDNPEIQKPRLFQPKSDAGRQYIFQYAKSIRNCDRAMINLFSDVTILSADETIHPVPIIWGSQEKAAIYVFGEQFVRNPERKENGLIDRITLPVMSIFGGSIAFDSNRYNYHEAIRWHGYGNEKKPYDVKFGYAKGIPIDRSYELNIWTKYVEHMSQILEQIFIKFSPIAYINVEGIDWETWVELGGHTDNIDSQVGDEAIRMVKASFSMTAKTHIAQPIKRAKTIQKIIEQYGVKGEVASQAIDEIITQIEPDQIPDDL